MEGQKACQSIVLDIQSIVSALEGEYLSMVSISICHPSKNQSNALSFALTHEPHTQTTSTHMHTGMA